MPETPLLVASIAVAVAVLALLAVAVLLAQVRRLRATLDRLTAGDEGLTFLGAMERQHAAGESLRTEMTQTRADLAAVRTDLSDALRHVAVVRYDAFDDLGGRLSFSAALLDDAGDGMVLTSINARSETRTYAKGVQAGASDHQLSPEEEQAIAHATRPPGPAPAAGPAARGRRRGLSRPRPA